MIWILVHLLEAETGPALNSEYQRKIIIGIITLVAADIVVPKVLKMKLGFEKY
jgi:hypothetical protein